MSSEGDRATGAVRFDFDPVVVHSNSHLDHGGHLVQAAPAGSLSWNRAHGVPYLQDTGTHGNRFAAMSRNSPGFMHPYQGSHNVYYPPLPPPTLPPPPPPMLPVQAQNMDIQLQPTLASQRHSTRTSGTYPFHNDHGPRFVGPALPRGVMVYEARRQQLMINSVVRQHNFLVSPEEAFLALREQLGEAVDSGLPVKFILDHLKTRIFASSRQLSQDLTPADEEPKFCVVCQMEFEDQEKIGMLDCGHEYHAKCIKKWLTVKNNCPVCKSTALR